MLDNTKDTKYNAYTLILANGKQQKLFQFQKEPGYTGVINRACRVRLPNVCHHHHPMNIFLSFQDYLHCKHDNSNEMEDAPLSLNAS